MRLRLATLFLAFLHMTANALMPIGIGDRVHACGTIVDENLNPVSDTLTLKVSIDRPLMRRGGGVVNHDYVYSITDAKFCIEGNFVMSLKAHIFGENIRADYFEVVYRGLNRKDFKWVVERNESMAEPPKLWNHHITIDTAERSRGFSVLFKESHALSNYGEMLFRPKWMKSLLEMAGIRSNINTKNEDSLFRAWDTEFPGTIAKTRWGLVGDTWTMSKPKYLFDYLMLQRHDSLFFVPGPLSKTKFVPATIDTPICNFGRLPAPPPIADPAWRDTLLIAIGTTPVLDAYYVHFPWIGKWAKVIINPKIDRTKTKVDVQVTHVLADVGDTRPFLFWTGRDRTYTDRRKCFTKAESMWAGEYTTHFLNLE